MKCLSLIDLASVVLNAVKLSLLVRPVILRQIKDSHAAVRRENGPAIAHICDVALFLDGHDHDSTGARLVEPASLVGHADEPFLGFSAAIEDCLSRVFRKAVLVYDDLVQVVLQEVSTHVTSVAIVDREERALRPLRRVFLLWPRHVQNNRHSVFIVVPLNALVRVCGVAGDQAVCFGGKLGVFEILKWVFHVDVIVGVSVAKEVCGADDAKRLRFQDTLNDASGLVLKFSLYLLNDLIELPELVPERILNCLLLDPGVSL